MNLSVDRERINNYVLELCRQNKVECNWHFSDTTNSMYYRVYTEDSDVCFRISDHAKKKNNIPSIIVGRSTKLFQISKFVQNRIKYLKQRPARTIFAEFMRAQNGIVSCAGEFHVYHIGGAKYGIAR